MEDVSLVKSEILTSLKAIFSAGLNSDTKAIGEDFSEVLLSFLEGKSGKPKAEENTGALSVLALEYFLKALPSDFKTLLSGPMGFEGKENGFLASANIVPNQDFLSSELFSFLSTNNNLENIFLFNPMENKENISEQNEPLSFLSQEIKNKDQLENRENSLFSSVFGKDELKAQEVLKETNYVVTPALQKEGTAEQVSAAAQSGLIADRGKELQEATRNLKFEHLSGEIAQKIRFALFKGESKAQIELYPSSLGKIEAKLILKEGELSVRFLVDNHRVGEALLANSLQLQRELLRQDINLTQIEVDWSSTSEDNYLAQERKNEEEGGFKNNFLTTNVSALTENNSSAQTNSVLDVWA